MKKLLLFSFFAFFLFSTSAQETIIWEEQFDGGIPGTWIIGPGNPAGAVWQWSASGKADSALLSSPTQALLWGDKDPITSPSVDNGAAMYNSDVYDTGGIAFGAGPYPGQQSGSLTSPMVDLSEHPVVNLKFNQYAHANGAAVSTLLDISHDGGLTWTNIPINPEIVLNHATDPGDVQLLDVSDIAGGQDSVQVRFTWNGRFYFWLIDDVQFIETPANNLALGSEVLYPPSSYAQPESHITTDTMHFRSDISNLGSADQTNVVLKAWVEDLEGTVLFQDSTLVETLIAGETDLPVSINKFFVPEDLNPENTYFIRYLVYSLDDPEGDFAPTNNTYSAPFVVTESEFAKDDGLGIEGVRTDADWMFGNVYEMSTNELIDGQFKAATASFSAAKILLDGPIAGEQVKLLLYKVSEQVLPDWSNFNLTSVGQGDDLELIAMDTFVFPSDYQNYALAEVELHNLSGEDQPILEAGTRYLLAIAYEGTANTILHGIDPDITYPQGSSLVYVNQWSLEGFGPGNAAVLRMNIDIVLKTDEPQLADDAMRLFPNPVRDQLNIDLSFETPEKALLILADTSGRVMTYRSMEEVGQKQVQLDVSRYPAGQYIIRLVAKNGTKTMLFTVVK